MSPASSMSSTWPQYGPVVILGAGPAGLSVGYELARRDVDFLLLERGAEVGEHFLHYSRNGFFCPWIHNLLPGSKISWSWLWRRCTPSAYAGYLAEYARQNQLPMMTETTVQQVLRRDERFIVETSQGILECELLINATGYFDKPLQPALEHLHTLVSDTPLQLRGMESADAPGLFFLGLDHLRNRRSRLIRGIREDARVVADLVARRASGLHR